MELVRQLLGIGANSINWYQAAIRAVIIYVTTLAMVRVGEKRFLGQHTAYDVIVGIILGSLVSSVINNLGAVAPTIVAGFVLVAMHWVFSFIAFHWNILDRFLEGKSHQIVKDGEIEWDQMKKNFLSRDDLVQELRRHMNTEDLGEIDKAFFERSGNISFIPYPPRARVLEVKVEKGVQTVRIVIEE